MWPDENVAVQHGVVYTAGMSLAHATTPDDKRETILKLVLHQSVNLQKSNAAAHEYDTAVNDLLAKNYFHLCKNFTGPRVARGPYHLSLSIEESRLVLNILRVNSEDGAEQGRERVTVPMSPFRRLVRDYFFISERYYEAMRTATPDQIQTIDMAKRSLHNEGAGVLMEVLKPAVEVDFDTARRLFTLICVLHIR